MIKKIYTTLVIFLLFSHLVSCSTSLYRDKRRIDRIVDRRQPEWVVGYVLSKYNTQNLIIGDTQTTIRSKETIYRIDTIIVRKDSIKNDTVYITKDALRVRYIKVKDTLKIDAECKSDTIFVYKDITKTVKYGDAIKKYKSLDIIYSIKDTFGIFIKNFIVFFLIGVLSFLAVQLILKYIKIL